ncbi:MAG: hypothetical protein OXN97_12310 [Bryobacterales bacterium]|nr:hypothetical protein [Bryobacterales bacterium]
MSESRAATLAAGNPCFFSRMRGGGTCTIRTYRRAVQWFSDNWPNGLEWPSDVPHPEPTLQSEKAA